jgi:hypothetical protein
MVTTDQGTVIRYHVDLLGHAGREPALAMAD